MLFHGFFARLAVYRIKGVEKNLRRTRSIRMSCADDPAIEHEMLALCARLVSCLRWCRCRSVRVCAQRHTKVECQGSEEEEGEDGDCDGEEHEEQSRQQQRRLQAWSWPACVRLLCQIRRSFIDSISDSKFILSFLCIVSVIRPNGEWRRALNRTEDAVNA